jgi:hypothetical protein
MSAGLRTMKMLEHARASCSETKDGERAAFTGGERAKKASDGGEDTSKDSEQWNREERRGAQEKR